jgi:glycosyltransferase involved in cell wall biosynthesis
MPITVAIVVGPRAMRWREALGSVRAQSHAPSAVLVVDAGHSEAHAIDQALVAFGLPARRIAVPGATNAEAVDAAIAATGEGAVALLDADHAFGPRHLEKLVAATGRERRAWAFGRVESAETEGAEHPALRASDIEQGDTVGAAFVSAHFPPVVATNLIVDRALAARAGPCARRGPLWAWSFALDLVARAEPAYAHDASYRIAQGDREIDRPGDEAALVALFRDYYARALTPGLRDNALAPSPESLGDAFFRRPLQSGHVLLFEPREIDALAERVLRWAKADAPRRRGVTFAGFPYGEFGLGENLRAVARACAAADIPFDVRDTGLRVSSRQRDRSMAPYVATGYSRAITVVCVNPDQLPQIDELIDHARHGGGRVAGFWFWELDRIPRTWEPWVERFDEIWVATSFVAGAVRAVTDRPVVVVPTPVEVGRARDYRRDEFGVPDGAFTFLFTFDYSSQPVRKNALAVVDAFRRAFPPGRRDVALVIKSSNARRFPEHHAALVARIAGDDRIVAFDRFLSRDAVWGLQSVCDCYVSLHRSEGLGLGLAECMLQGKPAIATRWSGNLDFMTPDNSALVDCTFVPVGDGEYPASNPGQQWAEPDVTQAAALMQRMVDDRRWREALAARGQYDVRERLSSASAAARMRERLEAIGAL